jgi:hypothetical protein
VIALTLFSLKIQDHFVLIVSEFLYIPWKYIREEVAKRATVRDDTSCTPSITVMAAENLEGQVIGYLCDQVILFILLSKLCSFEVDIEIANKVYFNYEPLLFTFS